MQTDLRLSSLMEGTLQEIGKLGLCSELNNQYRRAYGGLRRFARDRGEEDLYSADLLQSFLTDIQQRHQSGAIGPARRNHLKRASLLLRDFVATGRLNWKVYGSDRRPLPSSPEFLRLYSQYLDSLKSDGKSENTIGSSRNLVRQFLLFLENSGYHTLAETPLNR